MKNSLVKSEYKRMKIEFPALQINKQLDLKNIFQLIEKPRLFDPVFVLFSSFLFSTQGTHIGLPFLNEYNELTSVKNIYIRKYTFRLHLNNAIANCNQFKILMINIPFGQPENILFLIAILAGTSKYLSFVNSVSGIYLIFRKFVDFSIAFVCIKYLIEQFSFWNFCFWYMLHSIYSVNNKRAEPKTFECWIWWNEMFLVFFKKKSFISS